MKAALSNTERTKAAQKHEEKKGKRTKEVTSGKARKMSKMGKIVDGVLSKLEKIQTTEGKLAGKKILELIEKEGNNASNILLLNSLRVYDDYTFLHSVNVAVISTAIAKNLNFDEDTIDRTGIAALMHDIGKLYVPLEIIKKTGRLSPSEWQFVKRHPIDGERILKEEGADFICRRVAFEHHMRYDLRGYPMPKEKHQMHNASQIVRIADSYDALTTKRTYRKQINPYRAIELMVKSRSKEFHPYFFDVFMYVLGNIPIGSVLKLDTGEMVLLVEFNMKYGELPRVRVLKDAEGNDIKDGGIIDLNEIDAESKKYKRVITSIVDQTVRDVNVGNYLIDQE
ncbi:MAG: HD domain-containing protein, partial [Candidatus Krumholzibacteria bacterium]|nr:HD domain-containing protein [Candidatus Krumholzibacteria bacterium]